MIDAKSKMKILIIASVFTLLFLLAGLVCHLFVESMSLADNLTDWTQEKQINYITERVGMHV